MTLAVVVKCDQFVHNLLWRDGERGKRFPQFSQRLIHILYMRSGSALPTICGMVLFGFPRFLNKFFGEFSPKRTVYPQVSGVIHSFSTLIHKLL
jgi:hypothetical protein